MLGFLPYNFPRATVFLGDAGSHLVGYLLGVLAILPHFYSEEHPVRWAALNPLLILAVPFGDLISVILIRWRLGRPVYEGKTTIIGRTIWCAGERPTTAVLLLWLVASLAGAAAWW